MKEKPILWVVSLNFNAPEREQEFNKWYSETHVPDVVEAQGVIRATRYVALRAIEGQPKYLAIYEVESEQAINSILASPELKKAREDFHANWAQYVSDRSSFWYKPITP